MKQNGHSGSPVTLRMWLALFALVLAFGVGLLFSNGYDWDLFYTYNEIDLRIWVLDGQLPYWSYQLCSGSTRIGDAQSFGVSPLFVFVLLFGSFWGTKAIVWCCVGLGWWYATRLFLLFAWDEDFPQAITPTGHFVGALLGLLLVLSNVFLWHLFVGHVTYALFYLGLGIMYYTLKAWVGAWSRWDWPVSVALVFCYYTTGFYHPQIFMVLPFFAAIAFVMLVQLVSVWSQPLARGQWFRRVSVAVGFHLIGLVLGSYKLLAMLHYQGLYPRTVKAHEVVSWPFLLLSQMLPTWEHRVVGGFTSPKSLIWEESFFHMAGWGLLLCLMWVVYKRVQGEPLEVTPPRQVKENISSRWLLWFLLAYALVVLGFCMGDQADWSLHALLNRQVLNRSIRNIERYQVGLVLVFHLLLARVVLRREGLVQVLVRRAVWPILLLVLLNGWTFAKDIKQVKLGDFLALQKNRQTKRKMKIMFLTVPYTKMRYYGLARTNMYPLAMGGVGIPYCYNPVKINKPLERWMVKTYFARRERARKRAQQGLRVLQNPQVFKLIDTELTPVSASCLAGSYYTQQEVHLDPSCPHSVCLNLGHVNLYDYPNKHKAFDQVKSINKICRGTPPQVAAPSQRVLRVKGRSAAKPTSRPTSRPSTRPTSR